jgi:hypothetical protein
MPLMNYFKIAFLLLLLASCSKPEENFIKIPSEFNAVVQEEIMPNGERNLWLELSSMNSDYCEEDTLVYNGIQKDGYYSIEIFDSYKATDCLYRNYNLKSRIILPKFTDTLSIRVNLGTASTINCTIHNNKNDLRIEITDGIGLINKYPKTYKIPYNLLWGFAYPKSYGSNSELLMANFQKDIENDCPPTKHLEKGYYSYFTISDYNVLILNENTGITGNSTNFYYIHDKSEIELIEYFSTLASKYVDLVGYKITTGSGKEFNSY